MKTLHTIFCIVFVILAIIGIFVEKDATWSMACLAMARIEALEVKMKIIDLKKNMAVRLPYKVKLVNGYCDIITNYEGEILLLDSDKYFTTTEKGKWYRPFKKGEK